MTEESTGKTLLVAASVALVCSLMVSAAVSYLRPVQAAYQSLDRNRAILEAAGEMPADGLDDQAVVERFLELDARVVDLQSDWFTGGFDAHAYDHWSRDDEAQSLDQEVRYVPVYLLHDGNELQGVVLPVEGGGMWSTIYAYVALEADLNTIARLVIFRHGETPGIGDKIEEPSWRSTWQGKVIDDDSGELQFRVRKEPRGRNEVDAITGATVTSVAVGDLVRGWLGPDRLGPFLDTLAERGP